MLAATIILLAFAHLALLATVLPLIRGEAWWIRIFDFPRVQLTLLMVVVLICLLVLGELQSIAGRTTAPLLVIGILYQAYRMWPYTVMAPRQVASCEGRSNAENHLRLLTANVLMTNRDAEKLLELLVEHNPDIVLLVETDEWWEDSLRSLEDEYPHQAKHPLDNTYGMLLYSKLELREKDVRFLIDEEVPSIWTRLLLRSGRPFHLTCLHPRPPRPDKNQDSSQRDAELVLAAREVAKMSEPVVVLGDLNDVAWSHTTRLFQRISRLRDPRAGRGFFNSFHANYWFLRYPLDHIFASREFRLAELKRLGSFGSDHFPIFATLCLVSDDEKDDSRTSVARLEDGDKEEVHRKVAEARD